ncbi:MAG: TerD family protein [Clostridia bacterium]|nr:TerD family protein [Clostridia bacterium]
MAINLQKGQKVDLTKGNAGLSKIMVGLGWDPVKRGFFSFAKDFDCDASVLMLNSSDRLVNNDSVIYFGSLKSKCGSVVHSGDNRTGDGEGDDEKIFIELDKIPPHICKLVFVVNIYDCVDRKQDFGLIKNAYIRVLNMANKQELVRFVLSESYAGKTTLVTGEIYRHENEWKFGAIGEGTSETSLREIISRYSQR